MGKLSVIIITKDEETKIKDCLESVFWADEIILVDDESNDRTVNIASSYPNVKIFIKKMRDGFGPQKQYALEQTTCEWVLSLDADERITEKGREEIIGKIDSGGFDGFRFRLKNYVFNKFIYDSEPRNLRLFRKEAGKFSNSMVHESVIINGKIGVMVEPIIHYSKSTESIEKYINTLNFYSSLAAQNLYLKGRRINIFTIPVYLFLYPLYVFLRLLIFKGHWKDGSAGILLSLMRALEGFINYVKLWELQIRNE